MSPKERARNLLLSHLQPHQALIYRHWGFFYIQVPGMDEDGILDPEVKPQTYAVWDGYWIAVIEDRSPILFLGAHVHVNHMPLPDKLLAQKLMLETNSQYIWSIACQFPITGTSKPLPLQDGRFPPRKEWPEPFSWEPELRKAAAPLQFFGDYYGEAAIHEFMRSHDL